MPWLKRRRRGAVGTLFVLVALMALAGTPDLLSQPSLPVTPALPHTTEGLPVPADTSDLAKVIGTQISLGGIVLVLLDHIRRLYKREDEAKATAIGEKQREIEAGREDRRVLQAALERSNEITTTMRIAQNQTNDAVRGLQGSVDRNTTVTQSLNSNVERVIARAEAKR